MPCQVILLDGRRYPFFCYITYNTDEGYFNKFWVWPATDCEKETIVSFSSILSCLVQIAV